MALCSVVVLKALFIELSICISLHSLISTHRLSLAHIDLTTATKYAFNLTPAMITLALTPSSVFDVTGALRVKEEIESILEQKASEGWMSWFDV